MQNAFGFSKALTLGRADNDRAANSRANDRTKNQTIAVLMTAIVYVLVILIAPHSAGAKPSWYPKKSCRSAWGGRDRSKFNSSLDLNYAAYQKRLKAERVERRACFKDWTILVYMAADNDLSPYALWDLTEMEGAFAGATKAGSTLRSDLVVQVDTDDLSGVRRLHLFQRNDRPYRPPQSKAEFQGLDLNSIWSPAISIESEAAIRVKPSHAERLHAFLEWAVREYPSENTMVVLWGHGQGWTAFPQESSSLPGRLLNESALPTILRALPQPATQSVFGGVLFVPQSGERLTIPELKSIFDDVVTRTLEHSPIDLYVSDACLMQMAEVATELAPYARFISGSAQVQSYLGLPYRRLMYEINSGRYLGAGTLSGRNDPSLLVAQMLPELTEQSLNPISGNQGQADPKAHNSFTMSSLYSAALVSTFANSLSSFSLAMISYLREDPFRALDVALVMRSAPSFMGGGKDLGAFLGLLRILVDKERDSFGALTPGGERLYHQIDRLIDSIDGAMVSRAYGAGYRSQSSAFHLLGYRAFGIWIPSSLGELNTRERDFAQSSLHRDSHWLEWISLVLRGN